MLHFEMKNKSFFKLIYFFFRFSFQFFELVRFFSLLLIIIFSAPLRALCAIQLDHGAEVHESKQKLLALGTFTGDRPITNRNKLNRERILIEKYLEMERDQG